MTQTTVETIAVAINGTPRQVPWDATLRIAALGLDRVSSWWNNRRIVRRPALGDVRVEPGDALELVHFVGGG
jgi:sulfur carrier protein ThiS